MIKTIAFDGDDTLWHHENIFLHTKEKFRQLMEKYDAADNAVDEVSQAQIVNLPLYGYGIKGFSLSMVEEALRRTNGRITSEDIGRLLDFGKDMLRTPVILCNEVKETIETLYNQKKYCLLIITKGDLHDQEMKIAQSGLAQYFDFLEIISEKNEESYSRILHTQNIKPEEFLMVGNSVKSDVAPVLAIGGKAVHVPYYTTWGHEVVAEGTLPDFPVIKSLADLPDLLKTLD